MSNTPYLLPRARWGYRLGNDEIVDGMYRDGFNDPLSGLIMGETAEELAVEAGVDREAADAYARSRPSGAARRRASAGRFAAEIAPVAVAGRKGETVVDADEHPRDGVDAAESLAKLAPVFRPGGTVTAGNASGITDGAAALLVASEAAAAAARPRPGGLAARLGGGRRRPADHGHRTGAGDAQPARAQPASTSTTSTRSSSTRPSPRRCSPASPSCRSTRARVNPDGGAIALGHPIGATGARILVTLLHGMAARGQRLGLATLCVSGGMGLAVAGRARRPEAGSGVPHILIAYLARTRSPPTSTRSPRSASRSPRSSAPRRSAPPAATSTQLARGRRRPAAHRRRRRRPAPLRRGAGAARRTSTGRSPSATRWSGSCSTAARRAPHAGLRDLPRAPDGQRLPRRFALAGPRAARPGAAGHDNFDRTPASRPTTWRTTRRRPTSTIPSRAGSASSATRCRQQPPPPGGAPPGRRDRDRGARRPTASSRRPSRARARLVGLRRSSGTPRT